MSPANSLICTCFCIDSKHYLRETASRSAPPQATSVVWKVDADEHRWNWTRLSNHPVPPQSFNLRKASSWRSDMANFIQPVFGFSALETTQLPPAIHLCRDRKDHDSQRRDRILSSFLRPESGTFLHIWGDLLSKFHRETGGKGKDPQEKTQENSSGDGAAKLQISVPCDLVVVERILTLGGWRFVTQAAAIPPSSRVHSWSLQGTTTLVSLLLLYSFWSGRRDDQEGKAQASFMQT